jgi:hypothetical protein
MEKEQNKENENYNIFESLLSITFEEDNNCPLILKNENEALYDILSMYSSNLELELKKILLYKNYNLSLEMNINGIKFLQYNSINFDTLINHLDPFMELIINRLNLILLSTEAYNCYSNNINSHNINSLFNEKDDYIMKLLKNYFDVINYYSNTSKNRLLKIYTLKSLRDILPITKNIFIIIFNRLTNLNYFSGNNSNYGNNTYKNSSMTLENNFTERYDFRIPSLLIDAFCSFIQLLTSFINCFDEKNILNKSKFLNDNFISNNDWLNIVKFIFDYLFLSNLNKEYTIKMNNMNNPNYNNINNNALYKYERSASNSQRLGNVFFNKCSVCSILKDDNISKFNDNLSEIYKLRVKQLLTLIHFFYESNVYYQRIINININTVSNNINNNENNNTTPIINSINDADYMNNKKYWNNSLSNYLFYLNMLLNSKSGSVFDFFICSNGGNFLFSKIKLSIIFTHYNLTKNLLILQESSLNFPLKYSFIINEMTSLDVIRLHYISFIKLYNKNIIFNTNLSEVSSIIATSENFQQKKTIKAFVKDIHNDQNLLNILLNLCKMHLRCLFVISKNRNADVTNKFFQLKIVDYFTHEIQLEHEVAEKVYKFNQFNNHSNKNLNDVKSGSQHSLFNEKNKNFIMNKLELGKLNLGGIEKSEKKNKNLKNINEVSIEDNENDSCDKKKSEKIELDDISCEEEEEENEEDEDDFDEIPLVAPNNNVCSYKNKIPKLHMLSSSFSDNEENNTPSNQNKNNNNNDNNNDKGDEKKKINMKKLEIVPKDNKENADKEKDKNEEKIKNNENNNSGPKIKLNINLGLCKTKSNKNQLLQEEIDKKDKENKENNENKNNDVNEKAKIEKKNDEINKNSDNNNINKKEGPKIQLKLNLDLCKTKSNKNELLKKEILNNKNIKENIKSNNTNNTNNINNNTINTININNYLTNNNNKTNNTINNTLNNTNNNASNNNTLTLENSNTKN